MIITKSKEVTQVKDIATHKVCDKCKKKFKIPLKENGFDGDTWEVQEFYHIRFTGGYGSVFGDTEQVEIDLCQHCLHDMLTREGLWNVEKM